MKEEFQVNAYIDKMNFGFYGGTMTVTDDAVSYENGRFGLGKSADRNFVIPLQEITAVKDLTGTLFVIVRNNSKIYFVADPHLFAFSFGGVQKADKDIIDAINMARNSTSDDIPAHFSQVIESAQKRGHFGLYVAIALLIVWILWDFI